MFTLQMEVTKLLPAMSSKGICKLRFALISSSTLEQSAAAFGLHIGITTFKICLSPAFRSSCIVMLVDVHLQMVTIKVLTVALRHDPRPQAPNRRAQTPDP